MHFNVKLSKYSIGFSIALFYGSSVLAEETEYCYRYSLPEVGEIGYDPISGDDLGNVANLEESDQTVRLVIIDDGTQSRMETGITQEMEFEYIFDFGEARISFNIRGNLVGAPRGLYPPEIPPQFFPLFLTHGCARIGQTQRFIGKLPYGFYDWLPAADAFEWTMTLQEVEQILGEYYLTFAMSTQILDSSGNGLVSEERFPYKIPGPNREFTITLH